MEIIFLVVLLLAGVAGAGFSFLALLDPEGRGTKYLPLGIAGAFGAACAIGRMVWLAARPFIGG